MSNTKECPFCGETIKVVAKKCRFCGEWLDGHTRESVLGDQVEGDKITTGNFSDVKGTAVGNQAQGLSAENVEGSIIQAQDDVTLGKISATIFAYLFNIDPFI